MASIGGLGLNNLVGYKTKNYHLGDSPVISSTQPAEKAPSPVEEQGKPKSASDSFMEYMAMSDQEKLQYLILAQMGISKEEYDAMSPEEQAKVNEKVEERMRQIAETQNPQKDSSQPDNADKLNAAIDRTRASERSPILDLSA
jgi:hypothetical protein